MQPIAKISIIITTYNWPDALSRVLTSFAWQSLQPYEIIVADDGSTEETARVVEDWKKTHQTRISHVWQVNEGFQAAKIRNKAVARSKGDYLIFLDGDCIPLKHFTARHQGLAQRGSFVAGDRILLSKNITDTILHNQESPLNWSIADWCKHRVIGNCNRFLPLLCLPVPRHWSSKKWRNVKTCNLAMWKDDFIDVNGFDEAYQGWGYEDSDLVIRLLRKGIRRKSGQFSVPVAHLWHQEASRSNELENWQRLQQRLNCVEIQAQRGIQQYLEDDS